MFGGGGSVFWTIKTDELKSPSELTLKQTLEKSTWTESGTDRSESAAYGKNFVVSILPPRGVTPEEFIKNFGRYAQAKEGRVQFRLEIVKPQSQEPYKPQILVGWGRFSGAGQNPRKKATRKTATRKTAT
jgi:hypothetical protein